MITVHRSELVPGSESTLCLFTFTCLESDSWLDSRIPRYWLTLPPITFVRRNVILARHHLLSDNFHFWLLNTSKIVNKNHNRSFIKLYLIAHGLCVKTIIVFQREIYFVFKQTDGCYTFNILVRCLCGYGFRF